MKQIIRRVIDRKGRVVTAEYPEPHVGPQQVLVRNHYSLISSGTELGTLQKTPAELVKQTLSDPWMRNAVKQTIFSAGLAQTARRVWQEMITPREIGYSGAGEVLEVGAEVTGFAPGDRVAYAATGHAEIVAPAINHLVPVPDGLDLRHAAFVTVGGIAIQALRRAELQFGETVAIVGLGLVGQLAAQIAKAAGCVVIGIDIDPDRIELAKRCGADLGLDARDDLANKIADLTGKHGVDATLVCAASRSSEVINQSMEITRKQGRVVLVGYVKLDIHPKEFLYKEIDLRYSRAYGPGSYHRAYEKGRVDYPFGYVRWTEKRNLAELVRLIESGKKTGHGVKLEPLIGGTFQVEKAQDAFDAIRGGTLPSVAALIDYGAEGPAPRSQTLQVAQRAKKDGALGIGLIGVGNHTLAAHLPALKGMKGVEIRGLASATGKMAATMAGSAGATEVTTDACTIFADEQTDAVMICSGHAQHAEHLLAGLESGKALFVEKPLVTRREDLVAVLDALPDPPPMIALGLNRRYAPLLRRLKQDLPEIDSVTYHVASPRVPADHWTLDPVDGGGRMIAEAEHFIDLCHLLVGRHPIAVTARALSEPPEDLRSLISYSITIDYPGAVAHIVFHESGSAGHPRERITALAKGHVGMLDDFEQLTLHGREKKVIKKSRDMGHSEQLRQFIAALRGDESSLISWAESLEATTCLFAADESLRTGRRIELGAFRRGLLEKLDESAP